MSGAWARLGGLPPRELRRLLLALCALTLAQAALSAFFIATSDRSDELGVELALVLLIGASFATTGLFAWWRRPSNPVGALMWLTGFIGFFNAYLLSDAAGPFVLGFLLTNVSYGVLIHLLLVFPDGRLRAGLDRAVVLTGYFAVTVMQVIAALLIDPARHDCDGCPSNPLLLVENQGAYDSYSAIQTMVAIGALIGLVVALTRHWRAWPEVRRKQFAPVLYAGGASLSLITLQLVVGLTELSDGLRQSLFIASLVPFALVPPAFLAGLLRSRLTRAEAVGDLIAGLERGPGGGLRDALAGALSDPTVQLAYRVQETGGYVGSSGHPVVLPAEGESRAAVPVTHDGDPVGVIVYDATLEGSEELVPSVAAAAGLRMENERLDAELRARLEELRASRARIVEAGYRERRRVERDLHDGAQQRLMALALNLKLARSKVDRDPAEAGQLLDEATAELERATAELRELARGIHPGLLSDRGLVPALEALASRAPVPVELRTEVAERPAAGVEAATYFLVSEALANVAKHSGARRASVTVAQENGSLTIEVSDDGAGGADPEGSGLQGLADRVAALDGQFMVGDHDGGGTLVSASIPLR